ncbi:PfkB family carbohydrate kinase [Schaalia dentiphila]|uniref:PfkB family carbohydrate kinase n=1 Tax=Schaalia dentiphila TaxID=3050224 RepID=UPI002852CB60|nr:PfkB family carbohydrate kinase [Schaalia sp. C24]
MDPRLSHAHGALAGLALGDALGMPTQEMSPAQIRAVYGRITGLVDGDASQPYAPGMPAGSVTDDTEQALLVASLLIRGRGSSSGRVSLNAVEFAHALLAWEDSMIERGSLDLLGPSTKAALERVRAGEDPLTVGGEGTTNGAAMRVTPIGIAVSTEDPEAFAEAVWSSCRVTHATRQGFQSAALVAAAVSMGIDAARSTSPNLRGLLWKAVTYVDSLPEHGAWTPDPDVVAATRRAMQLAVNPASSSLECLAEQVGTSVASAHAIPMAFALLARDPSPQALMDAANIGGDTDTIGAIAGAILGAALGVEVLPTDSLSKIEEVSHLGLSTVAGDLLALRDQAIVGRQENSPTVAVSAADPDAGTSPEEPAPASSPDPRAGRVVLMGQILVDRVLQGTGPIYGGGSGRGTDEGIHVGAGFSALVAARRMGAEAISLSPIGDGPNASLIEEALKREGIVDAGPRVPDCDNAMRTVLIARNGSCTIIATKGAEAMAPENVWANYVCSLHPVDVLYIDGSLMDHPANRIAAENALRALPEGVRVVLDVSPTIGIPNGLPSSAIISMNYEESQVLWTRIPEKERQFLSWTPADNAATTLASRLHRDVLVHKDANGAYFAPYAPSDALPTFHIPTPRIRAVDSNGAGDAHSGVLSACLAQGVSLKRALLLANCAGALASTAAGPATCPPRAQIETAADALAEQED